MKLSIKFLMGGILAGLLFVFSVFFNPEMSVGKNIISNEDVSSPKPESSNELASENSSLSPVSSKADRYFSEDGRPSGKEFVAEEAARILEMVNQAKESQDGETLLAMLSTDQDYVVQKEIIMILRELKPKGAIQKIAQFADSQDFFVRVQSMKALGDLASHSENGEDQNFVVEFIKDSFVRRNSWDVQDRNNSASDSYNALGKIKSDRSFELLVSRLKIESDPMILFAILEALRHHDDPRCLESLIELDRSLAKIQEPLKHQRILFAALRDDLKGMIAQF